MSTHVDLFSVIGGFALCLKGSTRTIMYCEIDTRARDVLLKQMSLGNLQVAPIEHDVRKVCPPPCDVLTAGWPCIGFSACGKREGFANEHSALFGHVLRIVKCSNPSVVILENTPAVASVGSKDQSPWQILSWFLCGLEAYWASGKSEFQTPAVCREWAGDLVQEQERYEDGWRNV